MGIHATAVRHPFCEGHNIGLDLPLFYPEHLATRSAPSRLNFVADEESPVLVNDSGDLFEVLLGRRDETAHPLDGLGDERGNFPGSGRLNGTFQILRALEIATRIGEPKRTAVTVGIWYMMDIGTRRWIQSPGGMAGETHREL